MHLRYRTGCLVYMSTKHAPWRYFRPHAKACDNSHKLHYEVLAESFRGIALSRTSFQLNSSDRKSLTSSEQAPVVKDEDVVTSLQGVLKRAGPLPLSRISLYLDDDSMEYISGYAGGMLGFCSGYPSVFNVVVLPKRIHVLVSNEEYICIPPRDRKICMWIAAALVTALYMPKAIPLPVAPNTGQLLQYMSENLGEFFLSGTIQVSQAMLKDKLRQYPHIFAYHGDRICLAQHHFILLGNTADAVAQVMGLARRCTPSTTPSAPTAFTPASTTPTSRHAQVDVGMASLIAFIKTHVPSTFSVPLAYLLQCSGAEGVFGRDPTLDTVRASITNGVPNDFLWIQMIAPTLEGTYVRRLKPEDADCLDSEVIPPGVRGAVPGSAVTGESRLQPHQPPEIAAQAYNIFALGEKLTQELIRFKEQSELNYMRLVRGVRMMELESEVLSKDLVKEIEGFFGISKLPNSGLNCYLLIFDRLRHLYDVDVQQGCVRPWALLQPEEQPSSLTTTTTPLPLVLHSLQLMLSRGPLTTSVLYERLSKLCQRQLLSLYYQGSWMQIPKSELDTPDAIARGCESLRAFVEKHSLYFVERENGLLCTPAYLASEMAKSVSSSRKPNDFDYLVQRGTRRFSDFEMAEMIYNTLPTHEPVMWVSFSKIPEVRRSLPSEALNLRLEFFKRFISYFVTYEAFFNNRLILGRAGCDAPPLDVLQPPLNNIKAMIKFIALHSVGGVSESEILTTISKEGRAFMKTIGTCVDLVEQLPEWFEVRRDISHASSSIITYVGTKNASLEEEDSYFSEFLPLRKKLNNASLVEMTSDTAEFTYTENSELW
ncbi:unnamed protein product [Phytomonas sp. EM1]|nr:unnamed protein product [Phytomonas sp. EM1]|eukprot:CCW61927.1 unnamed protein product [Phytomonas sp. isolate EM1]